MPTGELDYWLEAKPLRGGYRIPLGMAWDGVGPGARAELLNASTAVDIMTDSYLELADVLEFFCKMRWRKMPKALRDGLSMEFSAWKSGPVVSVRRIE